MLQRLVSKIRAFGIRKEQARREVRTSNFTNILVFPRIDRGGAAIRQKDVLRADSREACAAILRLLYLLLQNFKMISHFKVCCIQWIEFSNQTFEPDELTQEESPANIYPLSRLVPVVRECRYVGIPGDQPSSLSKESRTRYYYLDT